MQQCTKAHKGSQRLTKAHKGCLVIQLGCNLRGGLPLRIQDSHVRRELVKEVIPERTLRLMTQSANANAMPIKLANKT